MNDPYYYLLGRRWLAFTWAIATGSTAQELAAQFRLTEDQAQAAMNAWAGLDHRHSVERESEYKHAVLVLHATAYMLSASEPA